MNEPNDARTGSVFLRIGTPEDGSKDRVVTTLVEIDGEGFIPREVGLAEDGTPLYVTRPGEYGRWNDSEVQRAPPGTPDFEKQWGGLGSAMSAQEFEAIFAKADATLPYTIGGTPLWVDRVVSWAIILGLLAVVAGVVYAVVRVIAAWSR